MSHRSVPSSERGQVLPLVIVLLPLLLFFAGAVVDIGSAYLVKGRLQAATDAAALAGAQRLPDSTAASAEARAYGAEPGARNAEGALSGVSTSVALGCAQPSRFCRADDPTTANALTVEQSGSFETSFLRLFGFSTISIDTKATACSPCGAKPLDVMIVLDRTGSMCTPKAADGTCIDLENAKEGIATFLGLVDHTSDRVGLTVLPPATDDVCGTPASYSASTTYTLVGLSSDYQSAAGGLDHTSQLVSTLDCLQAGGSTTYARAVDDAQAELDAHGRSGADPVIIFLSDGAANTGSSDPCQAGVDAAQRAKDKGTALYTIGYDLDGASGVVEPCTDVSSGLDAREALTLMASAGDDGLPNFYNKPDPGQLNSIFRRIAADIGQGTSRLIG